MKEVVENIEKKVLKIISLYRSSQSEKEEILLMNEKLKSDLNEKNAIIYPIYSTT
ncbi:MAG: hypothetical protein HOA52_05810, partial [Flavobacteriales bacterium]|nr:hypothetical protein [Flavobacteriales bacterium]